MPFSLKPRGVLYRIIRIRNRILIFSFPHPNDLPLRLVFWLLQEEIIRVFKKRRLDSWNCIEIWEVYVGRWSVGGIRLSDVIGVVDCSLRAERPRSVRIFPPLLLPLKGSRWIIMKKQQQTAVQSWDFFFFSFFFFVNLCLMRRSFLPERCCFL
jgi:hypothetical protein